MEKCPVPDCVGHLVERTNSHTGVKFTGCSEWPRTKCSGRVKYQCPDCGSTNKPDIIPIRSFSGLVRSADMQRLTNTFEAPDDVRFAYETLGHQENEFMDGWWDSQDSF